MSLTLVTAPTQEPISLAQVKSNAGYEESDIDSLFISWITAARIYAETYTNRQFVSAEWDIKLDAFPTGTIELPKPPVQSVTSITYIDVDGATQTWNSSLYKVDVDSEPARIEPAYGESYPATRSEMNAVTIRFIAGYGNAVDVRDTVKQAMQLLVGHWLEHREGVTEISLNKAPFAVDCLLMSERFIRVH